jgi:hypothetical protein
MTEPEGCPHCGHGWDSHADRSRCHCGCMWLPTPPQPTPPTPAELFLRRVEDVIWTELERQGDEGMGPYVDREMDMVDASGAGLNMTAVAAAVVAFFESRES